MQHQWSIGDKLLNPARPDWGVGSVTSLSPHVVNGKRGQRLGIRFDGAGLKTVSTAIIDLKPAEGPSHPSQDPIAALTQLPPILTDRSAGPRKQLTEAIAWYRFREGDRAAMDWAIQRLSVADPLSQISREQMLDAREGFFRQLDHLVRELARDLAKRDPESLQELRGRCPPAARALLGSDTRR